MDRKNQKIKIENYVKNEINQKRNVVRIEIKGSVMILAYTKKLIC